MEFLSQPWHWAISGLGLSIVMFNMIYLGKRFGISSSFEAMCDLAGAGRYNQFFKGAFKARTWQMMFVAGTIIGGAIGATLLKSPEPVRVSESTVEDLAALGVNSPETYEEGAGFLPDIISFEGLKSPAGLILIVLGGFLIGFGTRWAGGCTSGHAITGLSNLQFPSLIAVIGFFAGGLLITHFVLPIILGL